MIEIENLVKHFGRKTAVAGLDLKIEAGELFAFLGPNGAGKTTTIKLIAGLLRPTSGTITVGGHDIVREPEAAKSLLAYVPDQPFLYEKLTGREFLLFVAELYGMTRKAAEAKIEVLAERFGFAEYMDELCEGYSHGMRQRVVVGSALIHDPKAFLIDEPFVGLDPRSARTLKDSLRELASNDACVFLSTHTLSIARELAGRVGIIHQGRLVACGTPEEIGARERDLEEVFLEITSQNLPPEGAG